MFKDGDKIKCIDKGENKYITIDKEYTITACYLYPEDGSIAILNDNNQTCIYPSSLFKLVESPSIKKGDKLLCINLGKKDQYFRDLTIGKTYEVLSVDYKTSIIIRNDRGNRALCNRSCFKEVNSTFYKVNGISYKSLDEAREFFEALKKDNISSELIEVIDSYIEEEPTIEVRFRYDTETKWSVIGSFLTLEAAEACLVLKSKASCYHYKIVQKEKLLKEIN